MMRRQSFSAVLLALFGVLSAACSSSPERPPEAVTPVKPIVVTLIPAAIPYKDTNAAPSDVRAECDFDRTMPAYMVKEGEGKAQIEQPSLASTRHRKLMLVTQTLHTMGGGGYTGPKWLVIEGTLIEGGQIVGNFEARRQTFTGKITGCKTLQSLSEDIADDILEWLDKPTKNAKLGDAK